MGYRTVTDDLPVLRGRLLAGEQMTRNHGLPVPLAVEYDEFTVDIAENRLRVSLADIATLTRGAVLPEWRPTRLNGRYHDALQLADIVLAAQSFEHRIGELTVTGFMFDIWRIFEDFVCTALGEELSARGGHCQTQHTVHLDEANRIRMKPDLVWLSRHNRCRAVIDAKYKAERPDGFPDADLYQMLAYCTVLGLRDGHLVYAKGNEPVRTHRVKCASVAIHCHALDLSLPPTQLLGQVTTLAERIAGPP